MAAKSNKRMNKSTNLPNRDKIIIITKNRKHGTIERKKEAESKNLFLLASEMPNPPTHILEPGAPFARIASGDDLQPCPMKV